MSIDTTRIRRPEEGWLTLLLVAALALILASAIDDPAWVNGKGELTDGLWLCALLGVGFGFAGPKLRWGRWTTHLVGALFAGLLVPILAGFAALPGSAPAAAFNATADGTIDAYLDIAWRSLEFTREEIHYVVVLGIVAWGTSQFGSYAVFGHRRPLNAVVVMGLVLVLNATLTIDHLNYVLAFTIASLFLLIEMHAFDERATWIRRRIGDPTTISGMYLRGGTVFIVLAMLGSMLLTQRAASSPLAGAWDGVDDDLISFGERISRLLPMGGALRPIGGVQFGEVARITDTWITDPGIAFTATVPSTEEKLRWRAATYDTYGMTAWAQKNKTRFNVNAGEPIMEGLPENPEEDTTRPITVTVRPEQYEQGLMLVPGVPVTADQATELEITGSQGWFATVHMTDGHAPYTVDAAVLELGDSQELITGHRLEAAGTGYPAEIRDLYTQVPDDALGPDARALLATILDAAGTTNPYRLSVFMQNYLQTNPDFEYDTDLTDQSCDAGAVECFARTKHGYCLHYASTMAMLLRAADPAHPIPTRLVQGFLPGKRTGNTETVENLNAHAWVEVYFPGYGWIPFDPTGGIGAEPTVIADGPSLPPATPLASIGGTEAPDPTRFRGGDLPEAAGGTTGAGPADRALLVLFSVLLAVVVLTIAGAAWLRGPRGEVSPDTAWQSMARAASRFGFGPKPTQTVYEYASALGELVPVAKADLQTVADAKVETTYAGVRLGGARLDAVRAATRRLRISLLRLVVRRPRKGRGKRVSLR
ncbi:MAG TPA: transglutaminase domain-containing protein [Candidatus Limnocylindrales bacterium]|nr:transglutaminase domain-containing protein [Candidatus Limnocylindrales bacterium]